MRNLLLQPTLRETLQLSYRADFCAGYLIEQYAGGENAYRLLIEMQSLPSVVAIASINNKRLSFFGSCFTN